MGIKYSDETGRLKAVAEFTDISEDENKYRCELHSFRNETILYHVSHSVVPNSFATVWTIALQAPLFKGFPRQEY